MKPLSGNSSPSLDKKSIIIAIDGPAASGKSTAAYLLAKKLGLTYLDTGAMYRALTWKALNKNVDLEDENSLCELAASTQIDLGMQDELPGSRVWVDGREVSHLIRTPEVDKWVSRVSSIPEVRKALVKAQRKIAEEKSVVAEGRDIGTVVFPQADVKIFLVASPQERARRRWKELKDKGINCSLQEVKEQLHKRDKLDSERKASPLKRAPDAFLVDNSLLDVGETLQKLLTIIKSRIKIDWRKGNSLVV